MLKTLLIIVLLNGCINADLIYIKDIVTTKQVLSMNNIIITGRPLFCWVTHFFHDQQYSRRNHHRRNDQAYSGGLV